MNSWRWFGTPGHFICARWCRFHLTTQVGPWLVSSVGEYVPTPAVRAIFARSRGIAITAPHDSEMGEAEWIEKSGFEDIGAGRKYETMVFRAGKPCDRADCGCGLPEIDGHEIAVAAANERKPATENHHRLCALFARRDASWKPDWESADS